MTDKFFEGPQLRTGMNYDTHKASRESALVCKDDHMTQQHFRDDADINVLVERFRVTQQPPPGSIRPILYGDFTDLVDFQSAMNAVREAQVSFEQLPAKTRERFSNDPQKLMEFIADPENQPEAVRLGLAVAPPAKPEAPPAAPATGDATPPAGTPPAKP